MDTLYRLFTENDNKIVQSVTDTRAKMDQEIFAFKSKLSTFENDIRKMQFMQTEHQSVVD